MSKVTPILVRNVSDIIFPTRAWMRLIQANVRSSFPLNQCSPIDTNYTKTQYMDRGRIVKMYFRLRSLVLTPHVDPVIVDDIKSFCVVFAS